MACPLRRRRRARHGLLLLLGAGRGRRPCRARRAPHARPATSGRPRGALRHRRRRLLRRAVRRDGLRPDRHAPVDVCCAGIASIRPYPFWLLGSPVAFGVAIGLPIALYALRALARGEPIAFALAAIVVGAALLGLTKAETERIWLFLMPFAALAAATALPLHRIRLIVAALAAQALATGLLFVTAW